METTLSKDEIALKRHQEIIIKKARALRRKKSEISKKIRDREA